MPKKKQLINRLKEEITNLRTSPLYKYRTENKYLPVIGEGSVNSKIIIIGEAPGKNEALTARPFCGAAGKILDELLASIKLDRKDVYITNVVKDRPPENRDPTKKEIALYSPFLERQIEIIQPKIIATLGRFSMEFIMEKFGLQDKIQPISKIHGHKFQARAPFGKIHIIPLYHPAFALYNRKKLPDLIEDFKKLKVRN